MNGQAWAILGVIVGAILGGGAQIVADHYRANRERQQWVDDHRRAAYLDVIEATQALASAMRRDVIAGTDFTNVDYDRSQTAPAQATYNTARTAAVFYGSERIRSLLDQVDEALMVDGLRAASGKADIAAVLHQKVEPKLDSLYAAMRTELGLVA